MGTRYRVTLTDQERERLRAVTRPGKPAARPGRRAQILLLADGGKTDERIAAVLPCGLSTVARTRQRCVEESLNAALADRPRPGAAPKLSPKQQAFTVALACTKPPEGRLRWTMQLLADRLVELEVIPDISDESIRRLLKKTSSSPG
jgi:transposase